MASVLARLLVMCESLEDQGVKVAVLVEAAELWSAQQRQRKSSWYLLQVRNLWLRMFGGVGSALRRTQNVQCAAFVACALTHCDHCDPL